MSSENKNKKAAADAVAFLKVKEEFLAGLTETATPEEIESAEKEVADAKAVVESFEEKTGKKVKVKALEFLSGKYKLPYSENDVFEIDEKQASELIELKAVKLHKK